MAPLPPAKAAVRSGVRSGVKFCNPSSMPENSKSDPETRSGRYDGGGIIGCALYGPDKAQ
jgi:hypothetical protein